MGIRIPSVPLACSLLLAASTPNLVVGSEEDSISPEFLSTQRDYSFSKMRKAGLRARAKVGILVLIEPKSKYFRLPGAPWSLPQAPCSAMRTATDDP